jgi:uncharacterized protein YyaL (SSP411 family)
MSNPRLGGAKSPYLRQHAEDPVEWYVWGPDAFRRARTLDRPIFLSVGYSACHWCHVMQRESFKDPDTAAFLNDHFVAVKVDRELRPDVDALYMDYIVATTGAGGWPMSVFLTPDLVPLLGGTYFPMDRRGSVPSFRDVMEAVESAYRTGGADVTTAAEGTLRFLHEQAAPKATGPLDREAIEHAAEYLLRLIDVRNGGFGDAPKFPQLPALMFLCAYHRVDPDPDIEWGVHYTLTHIVRGGILDQAGGGLHRYAVDRGWRTPHFEKMLYDQGLLLSALAAAAPIPAEEGVADEYAHVARQTAAFLLREMAADGGGFVSALSADTLGIEGATYVWTREQLRAALKDPAYDIATSILGADTKEERFTLVRSHGRADRPEIVDGVLGAILAERDRRPQPERDDKIVTSWNALVARGLMEAGAAFGDPDMSALGLKTLVSVLERALGPEGLVHSAGDPSVADVHLIEDTAHVGAACLTAFDITGDPAWLERAVCLHKDTVAAFAENGVLYMCAATTELPVRPREQSDQPVPTGAAVAIENAVRLAEATGEDGYREFAEGALRQFWAIADFAPEHAGKALEAATRLVRG